MNEGLDQLLVMGAITAAIGFFVMRWIRKRRAGGACSGDCCATGKQKPRR